MLTSEERASMRAWVDSMPRAPWHVRDGAHSQFATSIFDRDGGVVAHVPSYDPDARMAYAYNLVHFLACIPALLDYAEEQDAEIARLTAELAAAREDTARLEKLAALLLRPPGSLTLRCTKEILEAGDGGDATTVRLSLPWPGKSFANVAPAPTALGALRITVDAARAAGEETR